MAEFVEVELERRLRLYQTFLKLYEHHSSLLDEILQLETVDKSLLAGVKSFYLQGVIDGSTAYAITNLDEGKTQTLKQPQKIWTIGRDRTSGIHLTNTYVSRRHAAIQYLEDEHSFSLIDFNSTNGSYLNGERVFQPVKLKDGDKIRLGNVVFYFFLNVKTLTLPTVAVELLMQLVPDKDRKVDLSSHQSTKTKVFTEDQDSTVEMLKSIGYIERDFADTPASQLFHLESSPEISEYFLSQQIPNTPCRE
ncbi:MAG: FHA domain-containing protein [Calothrix sp. CSU_2_0]|nr:FHA domain-containing protein [Calothrix sp. CSU_2_0]